MARAAGCMKHDVTKQCGKGKIMCCSSNRKNVVSPTYFRGCLEHVVGSHTPPRAKTGCFIDAQANYGVV
jgi:hypothetical protein